MNLFYIENAYNGTNTVTLTSKQVGVVSSGFYATSVQYSKDGSSWSTFYLSDGSTNTVTLNANEKVYFRNDSGKWNYFNTPNFCTSFKGDHPHIIGGDARSLLNYSNDNITLSQGCFYNLFFEDTQLTDASGLSLPSTTIATDAYKCMFKGCTSLTTPPSLQSAVNLNADCFEAMFSGCSSLTTAPVLRSTNLAFNCYGYMFHNCTALTAAPALPATTLADSCYSGMFQGCTSLTTPPVLPATTLIDYCYKQMFSGCSSLSSVVTYANDISATNCLYNWLSGVANSGTFRNLGSATYPTNSASGIPTGWTEVGPDTTDYFYIQNTYNGTNTVTLTTTQSGTQAAGTYATSVQYSKDKNSWTTLTLTAGGSNTITLESGEKVYFRNDSGKWNFFYSYNNYFRTIFTANQTHTVGGNINTLLDYTDLNNVTLSVGCFYYLFYNNTTLTSVPSDFLPATTLANWCYHLMFYGCTSLTTTPSLPATTLADSCYYQMFQGCTSLTTAPTLPVTTLAQNCYFQMFRDCTSLTTAPALPATTLASGCYNAMFYGCTSLTSAPALPATTLAERCYNYMFYGCTSLNEVTTYANDISASNCLNNWLQNVAATGTFHNNGSATYTPNSASGIPTGWSESTYFYIENTYSGSNTVTLTTTKSGTPTTGTYATSVEYSKDKRNWSSFTLTAGGTNTVSLRKNERVYFRNNSGQWNKYNSSTNNFYTTFTASQSHTVVGNANTLIDHEDPYNATLSEGCFVYLFNGDTNLTSSVKLELPSMTLANNCYRYMFLNCSSMTGSTSLPATTLAQNCYYQMFEGCTSLTTAPALPATTLARECYYDMFRGCSSLTSAPSLPATTLASYCYKQMFFNCTGLTTAPTLPATTLAIGCYSEMFRDCTSLTTAPALPATTLADYCYITMFYGCTSLTSAPALPATTLARECYYDMFRGCSSLTSAPSLPATTLASYCYKQMFFNCTGLTTAPTLPATKLASSCYESMFSGCTSLNEVTTYANDISASNCLNNWLQNVSNSGTFHNNGSATYTPNSASGIPTGWTEVGPTPSKTITATAGQNGSISPSGAVTVNVGAGQTFTFIPDTGYEVDTVTVDGSTVTLTNNTYTFSNVQSDHTISVTFKVQTFTINATAGQNGSISPSGSTTVNYGSSQTYTIIPDTGYEIDTLSIDGYATTPVSSYTFNNITASHTISVTFKLRTFTITAQGSHHALISPSGSVSVNYGADITFTLSSEQGYELDKLYVDGVETSYTGSTYTFTNVQSDHTIEIQAKIITFTLTSTAGQNGSISPSGSTTVNYGSSQTYTITPNIGYEIDTLTVDGSVVTSNTTYTFSNITANHAISVTFKLRTFTITATNSEGGEISPDGIITVEYDDDATFEITPSTGYLLWELLVDGVDKKDELVDNTYTFENVTANHTIHAVFDDIYLIVSVTSGPNGSITPTGDVEVIYNGNQIFNITPNEGYEIDKVMLDGVDVTDDVEDFNYTMRNIVENHILEVSFKETYIPEPKGFNLTGMKNTDYVKQYKK